MHRKTLMVLIFSLFVLPVALAPVFALDEAILTPVNIISGRPTRIIPAEDKEFNAAMSVWFSHKYKEGEKKLKEFSQKYPNSRWTAEADLHAGCYQIYMKDYDQAKKTFKKVLSRHPYGQIAIKAKIRLAIIAENTGNLEEAISLYSQVLQMQPTWDQFKYANGNARILILKLRKKQALLNCGPVALSACLKSMDKEYESGLAAQLTPNEDGTSMASLVLESGALGMPASAVELPLEELSNVKLPILAYLEPNHYAAILSVDGDNVVMVDSIHGQHKSTVQELSKKWGGKALTFNPSETLRPMTASAAMATLGGCCGQAQEPECWGSDASCRCRQGVVSGGGPNAGASGCSTCPSRGRPSWMLNTNNMNLVVTDTPAWYNTGQGPNVDLTLTYANENSNTGIFGRGWRSSYDMKVFFLPSGDDSHPGLQVHRDTGRIETYWWNGSAYSGGNYYYYGSLGYTDSIAIAGDGTVVLSFADGGKYYFKPSTDIAQGRIWKVEDTTGKQVICGYDSAGRLATITDANGQVSQVTTTGTGINERVTMVTLPDGRHADFAYTDGNLTSITDMGGYQTTLSYGTLAWGGSQVPYMATIENSAGKTKFAYEWWTEIGMAWTRDGIGIAGLHEVYECGPQEQYPSVPTWHYAWCSYNAAYTKLTHYPTSVVNGGNPCSVHWTGGLTKTYDSNAILYDALNYITDESGNTVVRYLYDWNRNRTSEFDANNNETKYTYDGTGNVLTRTDPLNKTWTYTYENNRVKTMKDPDNNTTTYTYNSYGQITQVTTPLGTVNQNTYSADGRLLSSTDGRGKVTTYGYNENEETRGFLTSITDPEGHTIRYHYDAAGRKDSVTDAAGKVTQYQYDDLDRVVKTIYPDSNYTQNTYACCHLDSKTDENGLETQYIYDSKNRLSQTIDTGGGVTTYNYDPVILDRVASVTDANRHTTEYQYYDNGKVKKMIYPDGTWESYTYDGAGNMLTKSDSAGKTIKYTYDKNNRVTKVTNGN